MPFANRELVRVKAMNESDAFVSILESCLSQDKMDRIEVLLFPRATREQRRAAAMEARALLARAGVAVDDPVMVSVSAAAEVATEAPVVVQE